MYDLFDPMLFRNASLLLCLCCTCALAAQGRYFAGAMVGISTLSADGVTSTSTDSFAVSLYKPENGPAFQVLGGIHWNDYLSLQFSYGWNRNDLTLSSFSSSSAFYEQTRGSVQQAAAGDLLVYFRKRRSRVRPFLAVGLGVTHLSSSARSLHANADAPPIPSERFGSTAPVVRFPVGIDVELDRGWHFRFTFMESIRNNVISTQLTPPGERGLANFENLFGFVKYF
jgi:Outer membrane protein beta-barrel domain